MDDGGLELVVFRGVVLRYENAVRKCSARVEFEGTKEGRKIKNNVLVARGEKVSI